MTAAIIPFPASRARPALPECRRVRLARRILLSDIAVDVRQPHQARADAIIELINTSDTAAEANEWRAEGDLLLVAMKGAQS